MRSSFSKCWFAGGAVAGTLLIGLALRSTAQTVPASPPVTPPPLPGLPDYLQPPVPPPEPQPVRPRQAPIRSAVSPTAPPYRLPAPGVRSAVVAPFPLTFDDELHEVTAPPGATNAVFEFRFVNASPDPVTIQRVHTSCGCTTAQLPAMPWVIDAGGEGAFAVTMDIRGKRQQVTKKVYLYTDKGFKALSVRVVIPDGDTAVSTERLRNLQIAAADRQAVFRGDCARCHSEPAKGKQGRALYQAVCAVCHEAEHRADMVPDLRRLEPTPDEAGWRRWVTHGKARTLMPAFAEAEGGPLTPEQVSSLVDYLVLRFAPAPGQSSIPRPAPPNLGSP